MAMSIYSASFDDNVCGFTQLMTAAGYTWLLNYWDEAQWKDINVSIEPPDDL